MRPLLLLTLALLACESLPPETGSRSASHVVAGTRDAPLVEHRAGDVLWVFRQGDKRLGIIVAGGELTRYAARITGMHEVRAPDEATLAAYFAAPR